MPNLFWLYFACFWTMLFGIVLAQWLDQRRQHQASRLVLFSMLIASLVIFAKGATMALDWSDPFEGGGAEMGNATARRRAGLVITVLSVWPYALMAAGAFFSYCAITFLRARR
jgi:hypothetical protein